MRGTTLAWLALLSVSRFGVVGVAEAEDISGIISTTKTIFEDSQLVGPVTCTITTDACIQFGASGITLRLNGFTINGPANPDVSSTCQPTSGNPTADGIRIVNQTNDQILGPGMVQKFRRHGINIVGTAGVSTRATVKYVTSHHNCFSGVFTNVMSDSVIEGIVSVRNSANSGVASCGGNCLFNSNNNHIWMNQFSGNGSVCGTADCSGPDPTVSSNNDFGVGLLGTSSGNLIEDNGIGGNANGILIAATASGNTIRHNTIAGNPPSLVSRVFGDIGTDVKDESATNGGRNTFDKNSCVTYRGPGPAPCPNFPPVPNPFMWIDEPQDRSTVVQPRIAGGWAIDLGAASGSGVDAIHVWAFPVGGGPAVFVAQAASSGARPDVGAGFGSQFTNSGYSYIINGLSPGVYDLGVYAHSTVSGTFNQFRVVRITVR